MTSSQLFVQLPNGDFSQASGEHIISEALSVLDGKIKRQGNIGSTEDAKALVALRLGSLRHEVFAVIFLDSQNRIIDYREMFRGTLTQASVYPREIVRESLELNAAALIVAHNHPSGVTAPSAADQSLTRVIKSTMALVDVRLLDHLIVGGGQVLSFAEAGLI